jgi:hypothetical protein
MFVNATLRNLELNIGNLATSACVNWMISLAHENTLFAQLKLINAMDTLHRSEHGDFNIDIIQFTQALVAKLPILSSRLRRVAFTNILEALAA